MKMKTDAYSDAYENYCHKKALKNKLAEIKQKHGDEGSKKLAEIKQKFGDEGSGAESDQSSESDWGNPDHKEVMEAWMNEIDEDGNLKKKPFRKKTTRRRRRSRLQIRRLRRNARRARR